MTRVVRARSRVVDTVVAIVVVDIVVGGIVDTVVVVHVIVGRIVATVVVVHVIVGRIVDTVVVVDVMVGRIVDTVVVIDVVRRARSRAVVGRGGVELAEIGGCGLGA